MKFHDLTKDEAREIVRSHGVLMAEDIAAEIRHIMSKAEEYAESQRVHEPDAAELYHCRKLSWLCGELSGFAALLDRLGSP